MTEAYLMRKKNVFQEFFGSLRKDGGNIYQIYIPEANRVLGYFKNEKMDFSEERFYNFVKMCDFEKLNEKVRKHKFVKKIEINDASLERLSMLKADFDDVKYSLYEEYKFIEYSVLKKNP